MKMKVTVAFGDVKVVVPCGNGDCTIRQLADSALTRYKKSLQKEMVGHQYTNKTIPDVIIQSLVLARDSGILDWDDYVKDVLDDRELIMANYQQTSDSEHSSTKTTPNVYNNNDISLTNDSGHHQINFGNPYSYQRLYSEPLADKSQINNDTSSMNNKPIKSMSKKDDQPIIWPIPPPPLSVVAENPTKLHSSSSPNKLHEIPSTNSTNETSEFVIGALKTNDVMHNSDSNNIPNKSPLPSTTIQPNTSTNSITSSSTTHSPFNNNLESVSLSSLSEKYNTNSSNDEGGCNNTNNPSSSDNASADHIPLIKSNISRTKQISQELSDISEETNRSHVSPPTTTTTTIANLPPPMPPLRSAFTKLTANPISIPTVINSESQFQSLKTNDNINSNNNHSLLDTSAILAKFKLPTQPKLSNENLNNNDNETTTSTKSEQSIPSLFESSEAAHNNEADNEWSMSGDVESSNGTNTSTIVSTLTTNVTTTSTSSDFNVSKNNNHCIDNTNANKHQNMISVSLKKSSIGFGFSLTSRHNPVDLTNPVYVSKVLDKGPAIQDGQMKAGDQIIIINDENVSRKSQKDVKEILLNIPVDTNVKIGLIRPSSDSISSLLFNCRSMPSNSSSTMPSNSGAITPIVSSNLVSNTANQIVNSNSQKTLLNNTGDEHKSTQVCKCISKQTHACSRLNFHHFLIPLRYTNLHNNNNNNSNNNNLSQVATITNTNTSPSSSSVVPLNSEVIPEPNFLSLTSGSGSGRTEPPAITLHHQNQLSPSSSTLNNEPSSSKHKKPPLPARILSSKLNPAPTPPPPQPSSQSSTILKASQATLGISVRRGTTQMSHSNHHKQKTSGTAYKKHPASNSPLTNNDNKNAHSRNSSNPAEESGYKICPNCHGFITHKSGVFVKSVIQGGAAFHDGRLQSGDELVAVQGICLYNSDEFQPPNNRALLDDHYDPLRYSLAHIYQHQQQQLHKVGTLDSSGCAINPESSVMTPLPATPSASAPITSSNSSSSSRSDPLSLLKHILNRVQNTATYVSLIILRKSLDQKSCSINTLASDDLTSTLKPLSSSMNSGCHSNFPTTSTNITIVSADVHTPTHQPHHLHGHHPHPMLAAASVGATAATFLSGDPIKMPGFLLQEKQQSDEDWNYRNCGERSERWNELHSKYHHERYYRNSRDDEDDDDRGKRGGGYVSSSTRSRSSSPAINKGGYYDDDDLLDDGDRDHDDLICLQSEHEANLDDNSDHHHHGGDYSPDLHDDDYDDHDDRNHDNDLDFDDREDDHNNPSPSHSNHMSSGFITDYDA